jgi:MYXO-CTERM domain-containing protein
MSCLRVVGIVGFGWAVAACQGAVPTDEVAQPVLGAELSTTDPAVVALTANGNVFCTGTLISPRVVLTAGHCVDGLGSNGSVFFGDFTGGTGLTFTIAQSASHPMWNGDLGNGHDIGLVLLDTIQDPTLPVALNTADLTTMIGDEYRVVGFGIHDRDTGELDGNKRTAVMRMASINGDYVELTDVDPTMDPDTAICQGDSGGPGFITVGGEELLAGVHSYSIMGCFNPSGDTRVHLFIDDFVQPWIDANDTTCNEDGVCARACTSDPDCMPCGADGTCATACELPDIDCPSQNIGEICRGDTQCMSGSCVYWDEDPRVKFCTQPCAAGCPDGMACQNVIGFGEVCYFTDEPAPGALGAACDEAADCAEYLCEANVCTYTCSIPQGKLCATGFLCQDHGSGARCYADPDAEEEGGGGCSTAGDNRGALLGLGLGLVFVLRRRRRGHGSAPDGATVRRLRLRRRRRR